jgi:predicted amidophosphoribosyltransferase
MGSGSASEPCMNLFKKYNRECSVCGTNLNYKIVLCGKCLCPKCDTMTDVTYYEIRGVIE